MEAVSRRRRRRFASREEARANFAAKPPLASFAPESLAAYVEHGLGDTADGAVELKCEPEHEARVFAGFRRNDISERLGEVHCPVVFAYGGAMEETQAPNLALQASQLRRARVTVVPGLGHLGPMEDPAAVAAAILAELPVPG
jgi:pimeloyl-ACP methyl ester carboxylesterase